MKEALLWCCVAGLIGFTGWYGYRVMRITRCMEKDMGEIFADARRYRWLRSRSTDADRQEREIDAAIEREDANVK